MKKLTCLLLALVLVLPLALIGCGSDDTASTAESTPATSTESSKATEDSSDAPSEDASEVISEEPSETPSEDVSEEPSEEPSETPSEEPSQDVSDETSDPGEDPDDPKEDEPVENIRDNPAYANVALNKTYTHSSLHPNNSGASYPDEGGKSLTDGKLPAADAKYSDATFAGFNSNTDYNVRGYATLTIDLGGLYLLDRFAIHYGSKAFLSVGISAPQFAWVYASNDGENWYKVGMTSHEDTDSTSCVASVLELDKPITARYVEFRTVAGGSTWIFVAEAEAFGIETDKELPFEEAETIKMLFVGNSSTYYFSVPDKLLLLAESAGINLEVTYCCVGSAWLHMFADPNSTTHGIPLRNHLNNTKFDYIVVQDNSNADYEDIKPAMDVLMPLFKENGGKVLLYMRYSSSTNPAQRPISGKRHHDNYLRLAEEFDIDKVAPVADAFLIGYKKYPELVLHHTDDSHHSDLGAYLIACVMGITYFDIDLDEVTYTAGFDADTVKKIKEIARIACEEGYDFN